MDFEGKARDYTARGTGTAWYKGWSLTEDERSKFRETTKAAQAAKAKAVNGFCDLPKHPIPTPRLTPNALMPQLVQHGLKGLSLFSGGGGLDIGFERAGYDHVASYDILEETGAVLGRARPEWLVFSGKEGDVTAVDWRRYRGAVDVLHGGPPCQPFSVAGGRRGADDVRDMVPEFVRAVLGIEPAAFVMENVAGLVGKRFADYVTSTVYDPLAPRYKIHQFTLSAERFGVPQRRRRVFFVGFRNKGAGDRFEPPLPTHNWGEVGSNLPRTMGLREALGLSDIGVDGLSPTLRSGWTGPRHTTSVVNSATSMKVWDQLKVWPNGVAPTREAASAYVAKNGHFRLSIPDCMLLQGFPEDWPIHPPVYKALGLIGNSVAPPMGYAVAKAVAKALQPRIVLQQSTPSS